MTKENSLLAPSDQAKVLAQAIYEIRTLLSGYLGSDNPSDMAVRQAAHLAYALHNQALATLDGKAFDVSEAIAQFGFADKVLGAGFAERFKRALPTR